VNEVLAHTGKYVRDNVDSVIGDFLCAATSGDTGVVE
jgi:hypothetical protein